MADYIPTYDVLDTVTGQVRKVAGQHIDAVVKYNGTLTAAVLDHFGQGVNTKTNTVVFVAATDGTATTTTGGVPLQIEEAVSLFVVMRVSRGDYESSTERLFRIVDLLTYDIFACTNKGEDVKQNIAGTQFAGRRSRVLDDANLMAYQVQWRVKPR